MQAVNDKRKSGINNKSKLKPIRICGLNYYYFLKNKTGKLLCLYFIALDPVSSITLESNITVSLQFSSVNWDWTRSSSMWRNRLHLAVLEGLPTNGFDAID